MKKFTRPEKVGPLLESFLAGIGYLGVSREGSIVASWPGAVGETLASVTRCERCEDGVLYVTVKSPVWRQELTYMKSELVSKINREAGRKLVHDIRFG